jgi:diguanylate cyclase (GGDEF)-like protein/PAS domain S-box-containing protein
MFKNPYNIEHQKRLQAGFLELPSWFEAAIPLYSIRKLISTSIVTVLVFFLVIVATSLVENLLTSYYQRTVSEEVLPLVLASHDLQENLSELVLFADALEKAENRQSLGLNRPISEIINETKANLIRLEMTTSDSGGLNKVKLQLESSLGGIERALYDLSLQKQMLLGTEASFIAFEDKTEQLFNSLILLEEELSGKVSLMSVRHQRLQKNKRVSRDDGVQRKIDLMATRMGLTLTRLGRLLSKFRVLKQKSELINFRDNELKQSFVLMKRQVRLFGGLSKEVHEAKGLSQITEEIALQIDKLHNLFLATDESFFAFAQQRMEQLSKIKSASSAFRTFTAEMSQGLKSIAVISEVRARKAVEKVQFSTLVGGWVIFVLGAILALLLVFLLATIMRRISQPIDRLNSAMHKLSAGDLSVRLSDEKIVSDEFARLWHDFNNFAERTERLVSEQQMIFDKAEIGIAWVRDRNYLKVNAKLLEIFKADEDYFANKESKIIYCEPEDHEMVGKGYAELEKGNIFTAEIKLKRADGSTFWCKLSGKSTGLGLKGDSVWLHEDITERKLAEEKLYKLANYDDLTGLPNRSFFTSMLEQAIQRSKRGNTEFAVLFIDLDRFKLINDSLGHDMGDRVLCEIADRIQNVIRSSDLAARLGGDEFTVIIDSFGTMTDLLNVAEKVNMELARSIIFDQRELFVGGSIGISVYPRDGLVSDELLSHADAAMYSAKEMGRNNAQFYNEKIGLNSEKFIELSSSLRLALENDEFELHFQPKVELKSRKIIGMEALIRWNRPEVGLVSPFEFIPILEESGLMSEVGSWVIQEAGRAYKKWVDKGLAPGHIAVNLSERQFNNDQLLDSLSAVLKETGIPASSLELEITESLMMGDTHNATKVLKEIKARGFDIAMDDFGTGYSSLAYLKRFPIDTIKIDRTFVRDIATDEDDSAIVDAILAIARQLKLKSVAEGIETEEQLSLLLTKECEIGQGYLFSKPVPADEMAALLKKAIL